MSFGKFLKKLARDWLKEEEPITDELDVVLNGQRVTIQAKSAVGTRLSCVPLQSNASAAYLIGPHQAVDQTRFWAIWKRFSPKVELSWEDVPPTSQNS